VTLKAKDSHKKGIVVNKVKHHELARQISGECIVLLKNDNAILPLQSQLKKIAIIGDFAKTPRYQGAGSSQVRPTQIANALEELQKLAKGIQFSFSSGYTPAGDTDAAKIAEAVQNAKEADVAIVFAGLPDIYESEGYDRKNIDMPEGHNQLIAEVAKVNKNVIVVLMNGAAVSMPWKNDVKAIVEAYLGGQAGGGAVADVLTGKVNPSGKLSETFPVRTEDTPTATDFPSKDGTATYGEGIFIGYRYYDKKKIEPNFPFGYGLSYTTFQYSDIKASSTNAKDSDAKDSDAITISFKVKNTGAVAGKEITELYVHEQDSDVARPENELKHFEKISLLPGEEKTVSFQLNSRDFAYYNTKIHDWTVRSGKFDIRVGGSSRNLPLQQTITIENTKPIKVTFTRDSMVKEIKNTPQGEVIVNQLIQGFMGTSNKLETEEDKKTAAFFAAMFGDLPINKFILLSGGKFTEDNMNAILTAINKN
jgi:beta-glucosidase